ncbi:hypothetical protein BMETH_2424_0 [methanotrophic bacterial endosymbiont of Bathymodiolus sp.]|nr:hypothetical protein BMETH_2424_0 [methanotrophic bacterial endosymbiont of Bathymodiolus sp.]
MVALCDCLCCGSGGNILRAHIGHGASAVSQIIGISLSC